MLTKLCVTSFICTCTYALSRVCTVAVQKGGLQLSLVCSMLTVKRETAHKEKQNLGSSNTSERFASFSLT